MESLRLEQDKLDKKGNLSKTIDDVQKTIDLLVAARQAIAAGMSNSLAIEKRQKNADRNRWKCRRANTRKAEATGQGFTRPGQLGRQGHLLGPQGLLQSLR